MKQQQTDVIIDHVDESIARALRSEAYFDAWILDIPGFSTPTQRRLVSNLCRGPVESYLEVGLYAGATFCAAVNNTYALRAYGVEDFSQPFGKEGIKDILKAGLLRTGYTLGKMAIAAKVIECDCWALKEWPHDPIDLFYYDGEHSHESQARALPHFLDRMADVFLFMVDDASWEPVKTGTNQGFMELHDKVDILHEWKLSDGKPDGPFWHNDVAIYLCRKK